MEDLSRSLPAFPIILQRKSISDYKTHSKHDKIQNILSIHHSDQKSRSLEIDLKTNSIKANQSDETKKIQKTFLFDSVSLKDNTCDNVLISAIRGVAEKKDGFILSVSRGLKNKAEHANRVLLQILVNWLLEYLVICSGNGNELRYSVRLSAMKINEELDTSKELGSPDEIAMNEAPISLEPRSSYRCSDTATANDILRRFHSSVEHRDTIKSHYLYTIHVYHHTIHSSITSSVSSQCSKIHLLTMDLTKQKNNENHLSPPLLAKLLMASLNKNHEKPDLQTDFQNILFDMCRRYSNNFSMITHISLKDKHLSDTYQMLQLANRIQRLKVKSKKYWSTKNDDCERANRPAMGTSAFRKEEKFSDTEIASTSEMSCAETVIFLGEEKRRNSDDESKRFRSLFMSSDSDSGYRDWKLTRFGGGSCGTTPIDESKKQIRLRTNALVWPKSALRMAKTAFMNGEELWVDGPNVVKKAEGKEPMQSAETVCCQITRPIMVCQETQCDDLSSINGKHVPEDVRPLSDISEITEDSDTLRNIKNCHRKEEYHFKSPTSQQLVTSDEYSNLESRNDVQNLSNWINDVNELTTYQDFFTRSLHETTTTTSAAANKLFLPMHNDSFNSHCYQYYDPGSQATEYNSYPRLCTQIQYKQKNPCTATTNKCLNTTPDLESGKSTEVLKTKNTPETNTKEKTTKSKSFSPFEMLKKTIMKKKRKDISENVFESQCSVPRCPELTYLMPTVPSPDESSDSTSSDSECNEWFRNVKTFKSKAECHKNKCTSMRPPSAPLLAGSCSVQRAPQYSFRQRSSSSGYGSVVTRDSEISSHHDSTSDQSIHGSLQNRQITHSSLSFVHNSHPGPPPPLLLSSSSTSSSQYNIITDDSDSNNPQLIAQRCELLVKQEKAFLLIQQQEIMIQDFYNSTRPLLTKDPSKYTLRVSTFDINRVSGDTQYLEELEEDTNIIRDSIAFYKSLVQLECSFVSSPDVARRNINY